MMHFQTGPTNSHNQLINYLDEVQKDIYTVLNHDTLSSFKKSISNRVLLINVVLLNWLLSTLHNLNFNGHFKTT